MQACEGREGLEGQVLENVVVGAGGTVNGDETCVMLRNCLMACSWSGV
jgi:hypothetical protein